MTTDTATRIDPPALAPPGWEWLAAGVLRTISVSPFWRLAPGEAGAAWVIHEAGQPDRETTDWRIFGLTKSLTSGRSARLATEAAILVRV